jgi:hypothetical protein
MREYVVTITRSDHPHPDKIAMFAKDRDEAIKYVKAAYRKVLIEVVGARLRKDTPEGNDEAERVTVQA